MIAQTIQLALAPVFVLVAIGNILNLLSGRLGRVVDRSRHLQGRHAETEGMEHDDIVREMRGIARRIELIGRAIRLLVSSGLAIGFTVVMLFVEEFAGLNLQVAVAACFIVSIALLMVALFQVMQEARIASDALRIPDAYLEPERDL